MGVRGSSATRARAALVRLLVEFVVGFIGGRRGALGTVGLGPHMHNSPIHMCIYMLTNCLQPVLYICVYTYTHMCIYMLTTTYASAVSSALSPFCRISATSATTSPLLRLLCVGC